MSRLRLILTAVFAGSLVLGLGMTSLMAGPEWIEPTKVLSIFTGGVTRSSSAAPDQDYNIVWNVRLPRILLGALVGMSLAAAGAAYQGLFRNPLADPFIIGASAGASLGAVMALVARVDISFLGFSAVPAAAFVGACVAVMMVWTIAAAGGGAFPVLTLLLAGIAVSSFLGALVSLLLIFSSPDNFARAFHWLIGNLPKDSWPRVQECWPYVLIGVGGLMLLSRPLDALACGDEAAASVGINTWWARTALLFFATLTTAAAVAVSGLIGFVGLISPHAARLLVGPRHWVVIPLSAAIGAALLIGADLIARTATYQELPVGLVTSLLGGPFFLYLLASRRSQLARV